VECDLPNSVIIADGTRRMTLTVTEAAHLLGVGRTLGYELARRYRDRSEQLALVPVVEH
jgi:hypothetical protein